MKFETRQDIKTNDKVFILTVTVLDYVKAKFDNLDRMLLRDCESKDATIADKLLALEMIARRVEDSTSREKQEK